MEPQVHALADGKPLIIAYHLLLTRLTKEQLRKRLLACESAVGSRGLRR